MDLGRSEWHKDEWSRVRVCPDRRESRVALYYFHLSDGHEVMIDPEGREIADPSHVAEYALKEARAMISQDALGGRIMLNQ